MSISTQGKLVCVTGASGYIASWLVKLLLLRGYTVHATVRDLSLKKVDHLLALDGANERLHLFKAELTKEGSFDEPIRGCNGVFHTASPCFFQSEDPQSHLIDPAVKGTLNVLRSCAKFGSIERVVFTSSMAALVCNKKPPTPEVVADESWVFDAESCRREKKWYPLSKTLAEETAWSYAKEKGIDLISINPGFVIGPLLQPKLNESCSIYLDLIKEKTYSNVARRAVHVKDVANAHILAFETRSANGRYCLVESVARFSEVLKILRGLYPTLQLPDRCRDENPAAQTCLVSQEKAKSLGIDFIPLETGLKEMFDSFKEKKFISF